MGIVHASGTTARLLALAWLVVAGTAWAQAPDTVEATALAPAAQTVLDRFTAAWEAEDHETLASLLAPDGAVVSLARGARPDTRTSPAQAHYVFKSLFQRTADHGLTTLSTARHAASATAVLDWRCRRGESRQRERLFISLSDDDGWRVDAVRSGN